MIFLKLEFFSSNWKFILNIRVSKFRTHSFIVRFFRDFLQIGNYSPNFFKVEISFGKFLLRRHFRHTQLRWVRRLPAPPLLSHSRHQHDQGAEESQASHRGQQQERVSILINLILCTISLKRKLFNDLFTLCGNIDY